MSRFELQPIENFPPDFDGRDLYVGSVRETLGISENERGRTVREKMRPLWEASKGMADGFKTRSDIMEVMFGDRVGEEYYLLGSFALHIEHPMTYDDFLAAVPSGYMWRQEELAKFA